MLEENTTPCIWEYRGEYQVYKITRCRIGMTNIREDCRWQNNMKTLQKLPIKTITGSVLKIRKILIDSRK